MGCAGLLDLKNMSHILLFGLLYLFCLIKELMRISTTNLIGVLILYYSYDTLTMSGSFTLSHIGNKMTSSASTWFKPLTTSKPWNQDPLKGFTHNDHQWTNYRPSRYHCTKPHQIRTQNYMVIGWYGIMWMGHSQWACINWDRGFLLFLYMIGALHYRHVVDFMTHGM